MKDNNSVRTANIIGRENHDIWKINDPDELQEWLQKAFPRMKFGKDNGIISREEWERFLSEEGTRFPFCQYTDGVALCSTNKKSAVVLVGDALHAFPPDCGQGVNSGLADVVQLGKSLEGVDLSIRKDESQADSLNESSKDIALGDAMKSFEKNRLSEVSNKGA